MPEQIRINSLLVEENELNKLQDNPNVEMNNCEVIDAKPVGIDHAESLLPAE